MICAQKISLVKLKSTLYRLSVVVLMTLVASIASVASAQVSLKSAVIQATEKDGGITALRQMMASRTIDISAARDGYYPTISLSGESSTTQSEGPGISLTVSQVLFDWGLIRSKIDAASQVRIQVVSELKMAVEALTLQVAEYYLDIEVMNMKIDRTQDYTIFASRIAGQALDRATAGISDRGEVARAQLEIARGDDQLEQLLANRSIALSQIEYLVDSKVPSVKSAPELNFTRKYGKNANLRAAVRIAPEYVAGQAKVAQAAAGIETAKASRLPTIKLQAQGRTDLSGGNSRAAIGISTGIDLSSSGLGRRAIQSAKLELKASKSSLDAKDRELTNIAKSAIQKISLLKARENSRDEQIKQLRSVLKTYEEQFIVGQRELLDVLTTARDLYDSQIEQIDSFDARKRTEYQAAHDLGVLGTLIISASNKR